MIYRCILPSWASESSPHLRKVQEGEFNPEQILELNSQYYNIYFLPNYPSHYEPGVTVDGSQIDTFEYVFVDFDLKEGKWANKQDFLSYLHEFLLKPSVVTDSGNGIHAYWQVKDLDAMSFLKLQRRLTRHFITDEAVAKIYQLMRVPGTINTKNPDDLKLCEVLSTSDAIYTCEQLDKELPNITQEDLVYCEQHYGKTYKKKQNVEIDERMPAKFSALLSKSDEVKAIWTGETDDRSKSDYRLGHIMFGSGFTKEEALSVLVNSSKALARAPIHRVSYAEGIVDKIWTYELSDDKETLNLSSSVRQILDKHGDDIKGTRFPCWSYLDNTVHGFRLGQVVGLVAGSGVGKTAMALNMFEGFVELNPDYDHFFVPLEQPANEIADRWKAMCGDKTHLYDKVHVISNYDDKGTFRHLSFDEIKDYILKFQEVTKRKVGCIVVDHIGALKKKGKDGENQDIMDICHAMKAFAIQTNTLLVMQSQSSRDKAGIGDLELNKDAAYGTVYFESYCDYVITLWQPLKRCHNDAGCPTVTAYKFCKIRHKKKNDLIQEDVPYRMFFDPDTGHLSGMTEDQETSFDFFNKKALNIRKRDRKTDLVTYTSIQFSNEVESTDGAVNSNSDSVGIK